MLIFPIYHEYYCSSDLDHHLVAAARKVAADGWAAAHNWREKWRKRRPINSPVHVIHYPLRTLSPQWVRRCAFKRLRKAIRKAILSR